MEDQNLDLPQKTATKLSFKILGSGAAVENAVRGLNEQAADGIEITNTTDVARLDQYSSCTIEAYVREGAAPVFGNILARTISHLHPVTVWLTRSDDNKRTAYVRGDVVHYETYIHTSEEEYTKTLSLIKKAYDALLHMDPRLFGKAAWVRRSSLDELVSTPDDRVPLAHLATLIHDRLETISQNSGDT